MIIPTVSVDGPEDSDSSHALSSQIYDALRTAGAFYVRGHGIPQRIVDRCFAATKAFHSLPAEQRLRLQARHFGGARGYIPSDMMSDDLDTESYALNPNAQPDKKPRVRRYEAFDVGRAAVSRDGSQLASMVLNDNPWPQIEGFKDSVLDYFEAMVSLGRTILSSLCPELGVDSTYFASRTQNPCCTLRLMHYPAGAAPDTEGIHPHTDFECLSILTGTASGLQVLNRQGEWLDVDPPRDSFLVIIGDLLEVLTNGRLESTLHRVLMSDVERYSLSFFFGLDYDVVVEPLTPLGGPVPGIYQPIRSGEHLVAMNVRTFRHLRRRVVLKEIALPMEVPVENPFIARKLERVRTERPS